MKPLTFAAIVLSTLVPVVIALADEEARAGGTDLAVIQEQIAIMRLVLTRSINGAFNELAGAQSKSSAGSEDAQAQAEQNASDTVSFNFAEGGGSYVGTIYSSLGGRTQFTVNTRGFYASGQGVFYTTEISTPLRPSELAPEDMPRPDVWELARKEIEGSTILKVIKDKDTLWILDPDYISAAVEATLHSVASYGLRIDQLLEDETITVGMRFTPRYNWPNYTGSGSIGPILQISSVQAEYVIVQLARQDLVALHDTYKGEVPTSAINEIKKRSVITRYGDAKVAVSASRSVNQAIQNRGRSRQGIR